MAGDKRPSPDEYVAMRRRRNFAVFGGIIFLCVVFYLITIVRLGVS